MSSLCPCVLCVGVTIKENKFVLMDEDMEHSFKVIIRLSNIHTATYVCTYTRALWWCVMTNCPSCVWTVEPGEVLTSTRTEFAWLGCLVIQVVRVCVCVGVHTCVWPSAVHHSFSKSQSCSCLQHLAALRSLMPAKVRGSDLSALSWEAVCGPAPLLEHSQHPWHPANMLPVDEKLVSVTSAARTDLRNLFKKSVFCCRIWTWTLFETVYK